MQIEDILYRIKNAQKLGDQVQLLALKSKMTDVKKWIDSQLFKEIGEIDDGEIWFIKNLIAHYFQQLKDQNDAKTF